MLCDPDQTVGFIYVEDFPATPPGKVYQVWLTRNGEQVSVGSIVDRKGEGMLVFHAKAALSHYDAAEITLESASTLQPTSPALVRGSITY